jgi:hypothetical protein
MPFFIIAANILKYYSVCYSLFFKKGIQKDNLCNRLHLIVKFKQGLNLNGFTKTIIFGRIDLIIELYEIALLFARLLSAQTIREGFIRGP